MTSGSQPRAPPDDVPAPPPPAAPPAGAAQARHLRSRGKRPRRLEAPAVEALLVSEGGRDGEAGPRWQHAVEPDPAAAGHGASERAEAQHVREGVRECGGGAPRFPGPAPFPGPRPLAARRGLWEAEPERRGRPCGWPRPRSCAFSGGKRRHEVTFTRARDLRLPERSSESALSTYARSQCVRCRRSNQRRCFRPQRTAPVQR